MGEAKRIAEREEKYRSKKISFIREHAPIFVAARIMAGHPVTSQVSVEVAESLFEEIEKKARQIATGENND